MILEAAPLVEVEPAPSLQIQVLGGFLVTQGSRLIENEQWRTGKARSLFKILLSRRGFQLSRQEAAELLWPELDPDRAANNLYQALYNLRRTLEPRLARGSTSHYLRTEGSKLQLNPTSISWVDLEEFNRLYRRAQLTNDLSLYEQAARLYQGEYLPEDLYEDWSVYRREALREDWIQLLLQMSALYQAQGQPEKYRQCLHRILESDFSQEEAIQKLMTTLAENNRREEALALYHNLVSKLQARLNAKPLPETYQIYRDIVDGKFPVRPGLTRLPDLASPDFLETPPSQKQANLTEPPAPLAGATNTGLSGSPIFNQKMASSTLQESKKPAVIGRNLEQWHWQRCLEQTKLGQGSFTLLTGEPGIGKTSLLRLLQAQAEQAGFEPLFISCYRQHANLPFSLIIELLAQIFQHLTGQELQEGLAYCNPRLYRFLPDLDLTHFSADSRFKAQLLETDSHSLFSSLVQMLAWFKKRRPLTILILDDLQNLSEASLGLLHYLLNYNYLHSLTVLGACRTLGWEPNLSSLLDTTASPQLYRLSRLTTSQLALLIEERFSLTPGAKLLKLIEQITDGNPHLALELVKAWQLAGELDEVVGSLERREDWNGQLPANLLLYNQRLFAGLSTEAKVLLSLAALVGETFSFEILRRVITHRSDGAGWWIHLDKTRLGQVLLELTEQGLIEECPGGYRFAYPFVMKFLIRNLPRSQQQCWRKVIAWASQPVKSARLGEA